MRFSGLISMNEKASLYKKRNWNFLFHCHRNLVNGRKVSNDCRLLRDAEIGLVMKLLFFWKLSRWKMINAKKEIRKLSINWSRQRSAVMCNGLWALSQFHMIIRLWTDNLKQFTISQLTWMMCGNFFIQSTSLTANLNNLFNYENWCFMFYYLRLWLDHRLVHRDFRVKVKKKTASIFCYGNVRIVISTIRNWKREKNSTKGVPASDTFITLLSAKKQKEIQKIEN